MQLINTLFPPLSPCLQLALREPSSRSRGPDYVSSVRSTVAPPSRPRRSAAAATAITVETWTDLKTCAPVSHTMTLESQHTHLSEAHLSAIIRPLKVIETHLHIFVHYKHISTWCHQQSNISSSNYRPTSALIYDSNLNFMPCISDRVSSNVSVLVLGFREQ